MDHAAHLEELQAKAAAFARTLQARPEGATLVTLSGELGAGKTSFVQGVARALGVAEQVTSPTFVLEKVYQLPEGGHGFAHLVHIDAYRLSGGAELGALGFDAIMRERGNLVLLEWPERVEGALPEPAARVLLAVDGTGRSLSYV